MSKAAKPKRSDDKYWSGTREFDHIQYESDLEDYITFLTLPVEGLPTDLEIATKIEANLAWTDEQVNKTKECLYWLKDIATKAIKNNV